MVSFVKDAKIRLVTKALLVGIGEVPEQQQEDGSYSPVCYASRKLSNVEKRHSQFEREALAVRWAYQKFCPASTCMESSLSSAQTTSRW